MKRLDAWVSLGIRSAAVRRAGCCLAVAALVAMLAPMAGAQDFGFRNLQGKVLGAHDQPINGAIVYLSNSRNNDVRTCISTSAGSYRFADLADDADYTVWAAWKGKRSSKRVLSSFDSRKLVYFDLHISAAAGKSARSGA
jgi:hypothetical protein